MRTEIRALSLRRVLYGTRFAKSTLVRTQALAQCSVWVFQDTKRED